MAHANAEHTTNLWFVGFEQSSNFVGLCTSAKLLHIFPDGMEKCSRLTQIRDLWEFMQSMNRRQIRLVIKFLRALPPRRS